VVGVLGTLLILGTIHHEREQAKEKQVLAVMEHLEGRLLVTLAAQQNSLSPQQLPAGIWIGADLLPIVGGQWLPKDPWGGNYVLTIQEQLIEFSSTESELKLLVELNLRN